VQPVARVLAELCGQRIEERAAGVELLQAIVLEVCTALERNARGARHETRLRTSTEVSFDKRELRASCQPHLEARIGGAVLRLGARHEQHLELHGRGARPAHLDREAVGGECLVEKREALVDRLRRFASHICGLRQERHRGRSDRRCRRMRRCKVAVDEHEACDAG